MKQNLTEDEAEMLAFLAGKGIFEQDEILKFLSHFTIWDEHYKLKVFTGLCSAGLVDVQHEEYIPTEGKTFGDKDFEIRYQAKGYHVPEDAKILLRNYQKEQDELKEKKRLESELLRSSVRANKTSIFNAGASLLIGIIVLIIQVRTCKRDEIKERREIQKATQDSLRQLLPTRHDSLYEKFLLRISQDNVDTSIDGTPKK